ncbi:MAG TPA: hypothetical protein VHC04_18040 [Rhodopila sp.]|nr:hypothetical protein [Rhodopila sp.]
MGAADTTDTTLSAATAYTAMTARRGGRFAGGEQMATVRIDPDTVAWTSAVPFYGPGAVHDGVDLIQLKILSDRRREGGGITWIVRFQPPPGKLIKVVAKALSDEHVFNLAGGRGTKSGTPARSSGAYSLNTEGQPHSAMIAQETESLIIYTGEPDQVLSVDLCDIA